MQPDIDAVESIAMPELAPELPRLDWKLCDAVEVEVVDAVCRILSLPPELEALDGKEIVVSGPSFACGEDLVEHEFQVRTVLLDFFRALLLVDGKQQSQTTDNLTTMIG